MDPQSEKAPGLRLPQPSVGEGVAFHAQYEDMPQKQETFNISPEQGGSGTAVAPPITAMPQPLPPTVSGTTDDVQAAQPPATPVDDSEADDLDKEWVNKAKMIVERTKEDPHVQSNEISKAKADYLRIRYNKHIKVAQDKAS